MRSTWSKPRRAREPSSSAAALCSGQNSHHSLLATTTSSRRTPALRNNSPNSTSEYPVGSGARPVSSLYRASSKKLMPSSLAAARIAAPVSAGRRSNVRQEPSDMADTSMPDEPRGRGLRQSAGIGQPPFDVPAAPAAGHRDHGELVVGATGPP